MGTPVKARPSTDIKDLWIEVHKIGGNYQSDCAQYEGENCYTRNGTKSVILAW